MYNLLLSPPPLCITQSGSDENKYIYVYLLICWCNYYVNVPLKLKGLYMSSISNCFPDLYSTFQKEPWVSLATQLLRSYIPL